MVGIGEELALQKLILLVADAGNDFTIEDRVRIALLLFEAQLFETSDY